MVFIFLHRGTLPTEGKIAKKSCDFWEHAGFTPLRVRGSLPPCGKICLTYGQSSNSWEAIPTWVVYQYQRRGSLALNEILCVVDSAFAKAATTPLSPQPL